MRSRTIIFAGGGTAGHIQPALAVARHWKQENPSDKIIFLGTSSGLETTLVPSAGFELLLITRVRVPRSPSISILKVPFQLIRSIGECRRILRGTDLLIGFGGYVCAPAYVAAALQKIPTVIHEANAKPGWANRLGALFTQSLATGIPIGRGKFANALITGIPLREDIAALLSANQDASQRHWADLQGREKEALGFDSSKPLLLVFGGSQGSQAINAVIEKARQEINKDSISILHVVGSSNTLPESTDGYRSVSYIQEMAGAYLAADLIISRSGAITCSEVRALGKFAIFVPLAIGNGEQSFNAQESVSRGSAVIIEQKSFTAQWLINNIRTMMSEGLNNSQGVDLSDLKASAKITALMDHAIRISKD